MSKTRDLLYHLGGVPVGLPYSWLKGPKGKVLFVAPFRTAASTSNGSTNASDSNPGTLAYPMKTIAAAYAQLTSGLGNIIYLLGFSNSAADITDDWSAKLTWSKNSTHLIGLGPGQAVSHRAGRIGQLSTATGVSPLLDVTGHNNLFANFQIFQGVADATSLINVRVTGQRNVFNNLHIAGVGDATMSAAGAACLSLDGGSENVFNDCVIGLDTVNWDADPVNLLCDGGASRNLFNRCHFQAYITAAGFVHVKIADGTGIDRWLRFHDCLFHTDSVNQGVTQTAVMDIPAGIVQGKVILTGQTAYLTDGATGAGDWGTDRGLVWANMPAAAAEQIL